MNAEARKDLLRILSRLHQLEAFANETIAKPMYADVAAQAKELTELLADMRAKVEQHLDQAT
jgi:hypothetical protein